MSCSFLMLQYSFVEMNVVMFHESFYFIRRIIIILDNVLRFLSLNIQWIRKDRTKKKHGQIVANCKRKSKRREKSIKMSKGLTWNTKEQPTGNNITKCSEIYMVSICIWCFFFSFACSYTQKMTKNSGNRV